MIHNLQLRQFNAGKSGGRFEIRADTGDNEATVYLYDVIGKDWIGEGVSSLDFAKALNQITAGTIHLRVNSPGGDVFEARAIQTTLRAHSARVVAHIDGLAASSATYIAMGADEIRMAEGAFFMIHNAWGLSIGNSAEMRAMADVLDKVDASICADYMAKTGMEEKKLCKMMDAETWMTAQEALDMKFVDSIFSGKKVKNQWDLTVYNKVPAIVAAEIEPEEPKEPEKPVYDLEMMRRRMNLIAAHV